MSTNELSLRGSGFGSVLATQRAYAKDRVARSKFGLLVPEAFVRGIRDLGYKSNGDAIAELIDNAIQAYAERIDIVFGYEGTSSIRKPTQIAVIDDGHGMERDMIRAAVMWGGTHRENDRTGLGRYGYGLPCASVSLGRKFSVYSKVADGGLFEVCLDLDDLLAGAYTNNDGDITVPEPRPATMPAFVSEHISAAYPKGWISGTVIVLDKLDRLDWATAQGLRENLDRQFAVTYHKLRGHAELFVDGVSVTPVDPLFLTPEFGLYDLDEDRAMALDPLRVEIRDPDNGEYRGAINVRYAWFPPSFGSVDKTRDAVGINANARFSFLKDYHGVIFSRNGRLIDVQSRTPWTTFINNDRYIKVEIEFAATLDESFGVTTSKQQVTVSPFIWNALREHGLPKAIEQLRIKVKEQKIARRLSLLSPTDGDGRLSERTMQVIDRELRSVAEPIQPSLPLWLTPYDLRFEHDVRGPFFTTAFDDDLRALSINTAHPFFADIYNGPGSSPEIRTSLEILLFCLGDAIKGTKFAKSDVISSWSQRLDAALNMLATQGFVESDNDEG